MNNNKTHAPEAQNSESPKKNKDNYPNQTKQMDEEKRYEEPVAEQSISSKSEPVQEQAKNESSENVSFISFIGGDILTHEFLRRQKGLLILILIYTIFYIANRYACQQELIEIDRLKKELVDMKYNTLTRSSELTEKSRQSKIEEYVSKEESNLQTSTTPPYLIK